jgi:hypothetical protein
LVKSILRSLLCGFAATAALTPCFAQPPAPTPTVREIPRPFSLTAGGFIPFSGEAVTLGSATYLSISFSYIPVRSNLGVRADLFRGQSNNGELNAYGIGPAYQVTAGRFRGNKMHYGASVGFFGAHGRQVEPRRSDSTTGIGGRLYGGMVFRETIVVELSYCDFPGAFDTRPRGFALQIGTRF